MQTGVSIIYVNISIHTFFYHMPFRHCSHCCTFEIIITVKLYIKKNIFSFQWGSFRKLLFGLLKLFSGFLVHTCLHSQRQKVIAGRSSSSRISLMLCCCSLAEIWHAHDRNSSLHGRAWGCFNLSTPLGILHPTVDIHRWSCVTSFHLVRATGPALCCYVAYLIFLPMQDFNVHRLINWVWYIHASVVYFYLLLCQYTKYSIQVHRYLPFLNQCFFSNWITSQNKVKCSLQKLHLVHMVTSIVTLYSFFSKRIYKRPMWYMRFSKE